ncbi:dATP/dGTP pyrophosphohydrolase domain-containing protein [Denitromonas iodatirespirans]|nr:dATP/dGTP pyrophosphohydrolase domain-containing protein [Denitromonas iodatirespirans]
MTTKTNILDRLSRLNLFIGAAMTAVTADDYAAADALINDARRDIAAIDDLITSNTLGVPQFDLVAHLHRQKAFSLEAFGPGIRTQGVCDHIRKELLEIEANPEDIMEWIDVVLLALDGAWRCGIRPEWIAYCLDDKQTINESRTWPDWRTADPGKAIEHVRGA